MERFRHIAGFDYDTYRAAYDAYFRGFMERGEIPLKQGVKELLGWLRLHGKKSGLATSTYAEKAMHELHMAGIDGLFDAVVTGDTVKNSKPDPEIYLKCLKKLDLPAERALGVEDSYNGIRSLSAAGMHPIMVPDILPVTDEMRGKAELILPDLNEVCRYLEKQMSVAVS